MLRVTGILLLSISIVSVGFLYAEGLKLRKRYLQCLIRFSMSLVNEMQCKNKNLFQIFSESSVKELSFLNGLKKEDMSEPLIVKKTVANAGIQGEDAETVTEFLLNLGTSEISGQRMHCEYYSAVFEDKRNEAERLYCEKGKPAMILSTLGGLALFIILI